MSAEVMKIGAVIYSAGKGPEADTILCEVAECLQAEGVRLGGAVQCNTHGGDRCRCDMTLKDLASDRTILISENRGIESRGCRLDSFALEELVGLVWASLEAGIDMLVVNKFGKREAEGHGFRQAIEAACASGVPILVMVSSDYKPAWNDYIGAAGEELPFKKSAMLEWCLRMVKPQGQPAVHGQEAVAHQVSD